MLVMEAENEYTWEMGTPVVEVARHVLWWCETVIEWMITADSKGHSTGLIRL